ncbi:hypothetical protein [Laribacter hongkongensis]|uniref:hypothetical protein n=1 Tax=Laribacter hongkongensis TaxID=168471 RepID=UPI001EFCAC7D|nr:hypothetical protein [Laribacter hongkongensis]MCG9076222.1 hypothetical protein [Laribacter hongkongensis]
MSFTVPVLGQSAFRNVLSRMDGFSSALMLANIEPTAGQVVQAYVKAFPPDSRGLINEVTGWILAGTRRLTQPRFAWLIWLPWEVITRTWPERDWGDYDPAGYPAFATLRLAGSVPNTRINHRSGSDLAELASWPKLPDKIAFDEWVANADSNAGNLIRLAPGRFAGVDHGEIFGGQYWEASTLPNWQGGSTKLWHIVADTYGRSELASAIRTAAAHHDSTLTGALPALYTFWLHALEDSDIGAVVRWIKARATR